jgi:hypothetical protein
MALPLTTCGLRLSDEAIRVAVGLRLGLSICEPHKCPCGAPADARGIHSLSCKQGSGKAIRHSQLNDIIWRAMQRAGIPATKEPSGLSFTDDRRPDGLTLVPWSNGRYATWDVTVINTLADSYLPTSSQQAGGAAEFAATKKETKYADLAQRYTFVPIAVETLGAINSSGMHFLSDLGHRITAITGETRESYYLFQRVSVLIQRFNAVLFHDCFDFARDEDD